MKKILILTALLIASLSASAQNEPHGQTAESGELYVLFTPSDRNAPAGIYH